MKNWKGIGRTWSWPNRGTVLVFPRRDWGKRRENLGCPTTRSRCEPRTIVIQGWSVPTTTATPDRWVVIWFKLCIYIKVFETRQLVCRRFTPESLGDSNTKNVNTYYCVIGYDAVLFGAWQVLFLCTSVRISDGSTFVKILDSMNRKKKIYMYIWNKAGRFGRQKSLCRAWPSGPTWTQPVTVVRCNRRLATVRHDGTQRLPRYASLCLVSPRCLQPNQTRDLQRRPAPARYSQLVDTLL